MLASSHLFRVLVGLAVSSWSLYLLWACDLKCVSTPGETSSLLNRIWVWGLSDNLSFRAQMDTGRILSPAALLSLCLVSPWRILLWTVIGEKVVISPLGLVVRAFLGDHLSPGGI